jgi:hypothetical protein
MHYGIQWNETLDCQHIYCGRRACHDCAVRGQLQFPFAFIGSIYYIKGLGQGAREDSHFRGSLQSQPTVRQGDIEFQNVRIR